MRQAYLRAMPTVDIRITYKDPVIILVPDNTDLDDEEAMEMLKDTLSDEVSALLCPHVVLTSSSVHTLVA